ncbi:hypothetical protein A9G34_01895 [Gilliamella sp. Choc4-2]|jgi:glycosyltransferase involved in cell wall biosynthesis|uniref:glycosyltransferase family 2 protein n=1 Tax=unclassified Gilliamella TaxID=2685620 RepID=UPI00080E1F51|nr:glycosyltransferase [Gilliamella apicola]OCG32041.1 hypothetical protein A9G33_04330 [Gilliamella apicola]OCG45114.1 hypothetical protein A9G34_01895 [Gilliamella apicola]OCG54686.1 hypothetical protein A9G36_07565 [Gilliamella apicola]
MSLDISIIVPVYNCDKYLKKSIDSLLNQTIDNIEIICIDDGSTDESLNILKDYASKHSHIVLLSQENQGPAIARNRGLAIAQGEYIMFCDSDDWYEPTMCEKMLETIRLKNVDMVMCDCNIVKYDKSYDVRDDDINYHKLNIFGYHTLTFELRHKVSSVLWNKIFKKSIIDKFNIDFPSGYYHDDVAFILQYLCSSKNLYAIDCNLYNYVFRSNSIMHQTYFTPNHEKKLFDVIDAMKYFYSKLVENNNLVGNKKLFITKLVSVIQWVLKYNNNEEKMVYFLNYCNEKLIFDLDLDIFPESNERYYINMVKDKNYDFFRKLHNIQKENNISSQKEIKKITKVNKMIFGKILVIIRSYLLFPYYIYRIYKKL